MCSLADGPGVCPDQGADAAEARDTGSSPAGAAGGVVNVLHSVGGVRGTQAGDAQDEDGATHEDGSMQEVRNCITHLRQQHGKLSCLSRPQQVLGLLPVCIILRRNLFDDLLCS